MNKKMNELEIKRALDITDWRFASKEKIINFVNMLPKIDKEVAINIIKQFPNFADLSKEMVGGLLQQCNNALEKAKEGKDEVIEYYKDILESYKKDLESGILSLEEKNSLRDKMVEIIEKIDLTDNERNNFAKDILKGAGSLAMGVVILGAAILGVEKL